MRPPLASAYKWMRISKLLLPLFMFLKTSRRDFSSIQGAYAAMTKGSCAKGHRSALPISSFPTVPILSFSTSFGLSRNKQLPLTSEDKRVFLFSGDAGLQPEPEFPKMRHWHGYFISQGTWDSDDLATSRFPASFVTLPRRAGAY